MFLIGAGQVFLLNAIVNLSNDWFSPRERVFMTSIFNTFNFSGMIAGFVIPKFFVDTDEKDMSISR